MINSTTTSFQINTKIVILFDLEEDWKNMKKPNLPFTSILIISVHGIL